MASSIVVEALRDLRPEDPLEGAIRRASRQILEAQGDERFAGMATTAVALRYSQLTSFFGTGSGLTAEVVHVGDSRAINWVAADFIVTLWILLAAFAVFLVLRATTG